MERKPYYISKDILGGYHLNVLTNPFGSWYYRGINKTFKSEDEAIRYYDRMEESNRAISRNCLSVKKK